jgi:S-adenosylmethionine uptake transporter
MLPSRFGPAAGAVTGIGLLSIMDGLVKFVGANHSTLQVVALRYAFGALIAYAAFRAARTPWPDVATFKPHAWRSVVVVVTSITFFYSIMTLPLAVALTLSFTSPIFIALFAALLLHERPGGQIFIALGLGFAGILVVLWDQLGKAGESSLLGVVAAVASSVSYALSMVALKSRAARDPITTIVLLQNGLATLLIAPAAAMQFTAPTGIEILMFVVIGVLGSFGHMCMAWAYGRADASRLGVFEYTAFVWAVAIGFLVFSEIPTFGTLAGAAFIVAGAMLASRGPVAVAAREPEVEVGP